MVNRQEKVESLHSQSAPSFLARYRNNYDLHYADYCGIQYGIEGPKMMIPNDFGDHNPLHLKNRNVMGTFFLFFTYSLNIHTQP